MEGVERTRAEGGRRREAGEPGELSGAAAIGSPHRGSLTSSSFSLRLE